MAVRGQSVYELMKCDGTCRWFSLVVDDIVVVILFATATLNHDQHFILAAHTSPLFYMEERMLLLHDTLPCAKQSSVAVIVMVICSRRIFLSARAPTFNFEHVNVWMNNFFFVFVSFLCVSFPGWHMRRRDGVCVSWKSCCVQHSRKPSESDDYGLIKTILTCKYFN